LIRSELEIDKAGQPQTAKSEHISFHLVQIEDTLNLFYQNAFYEYIIQPIL